jgi:hypothetical protein
MAQINKPTDYFNTILWSGNSSTNALTGVGFQPDWVWVKERSSISNHQTYDAVRGTTKQLEPNNSGAEGTISTGITSFDTDGFTVGNNSDLNSSGETYVGFNWKASNATAVSNTDGSITSNVSPNTTAGFSIVTFTANGTAGATIGHGLGVAPSMIILKDRSSASHNWFIYHKSLGATKYLRLDETDGANTLTAIWNDTEPTSSVFTLGDNANVNTNTNNIVAYCFAEKKGYSKFGSYTGNGNADGSFIFTGFKPAWVMVKKSSGTNAWLIHDIKRSPLNAMDNQLFANTNGAEDTTSTNNNFDFLSNGFKARNTGDAYNGSGGTYIYMAFAEQPLVGTNNIPATAR